MLYANEKGCVRTDYREMDVMADPRGNSDLAFVAAFVFELDVAVHDDDDKEIERANSIINFS